MGGPLDPEYWMESSPATGDDLDDIIAAVGEQRALARVPPPPPGTAELGSRGTPFDPMAVPASHADINYPPYQESQFRTTRGLPVAESVVAPAFAQSGLGTQLQTPIPIGDLTADGILDLQYRLTVSEATPLERAEIMMAAAQETDAVLPAFRMPSSSDSCTMLDDLEVGYANETAALAETLDVRPLARAPDVPPVSAEVVTEIGEAMPPVTPQAPHGPTATWRVLGAAGALGAMYQGGEAVEELVEGEYEYAAIDGAASVAGYGTSMAGMGLLGDGAIATMLALPPVAVVAAALGLASAGHHRQAEHDTWGEPTRDEHGEEHHLTSLDFVEANASRAYDESHDTMYDAVGGGIAGDVVGTTFGAINGGGAGLMAGMIGLGGDLYGGVQSTVDAASSLFSWLAD